MCSTALRLYVPHSAAVWCQPLQLQPWQTASVTQQRSSFLVALTRVLACCVLQLEEDCKVECLKEWHAYKVGVLLQLLARAAECGTSKTRDFKTAARGRRGGTACHSHGVGRLSVGTVLVTIVSNCSY